MRWLFWDKPSRDHIGVTMGLSGKKVHQELKYDFLLRSSPVWLRDTDNNLAVAELLSGGGVGRMCCTVPGGGRREQLRIQS